MTFCGEGPGKKVYMNKESIMINFRQLAAGVLLFSAMGAQADFNWRRRYRVSTAPKRIALVTSTVIPRKLCRFLVSLLV